nr:MAG TPA: hypothetical protein [Caudoviricetes sp.]
METRRRTRKADRRGARCLRTMPYLFGRSFSQREAGGDEQKNYT